MYCLSKGGSNLVDTKSLHIEVTIKEIQGEYENATYKEKYKILANGEYFMSEFNTKDEAKEQLKIVLVALVEGRDKFEF